MRFSCKIFLENSASVVVPADSRRYLLSMIKEAFIKSGNDGRVFYDVVYSGNNPKPFTFSAYFPLKNENGTQKLDGEFFSFFFSTNDYEFLMRIYNGLNSIRGFNLFGHNIKDVKHFFLAPERRFDKDKVVFKTLSPFLVRDTKDGDYYLVPKDVQVQCKHDPQHWQKWKYVDKNQFIEALLTSLQNQIEKTIGTNNEIKINEVKLTAVPILHGSGNQDHAFAITYPGLKGNIVIKSSPEVLKVIYDIGIGARRSEGFGMLEVVE